MARQYILDNQVKLLEQELDREPNEGTKIDEDGRTLLFWAISQNNPEMVSIILKKCTNDLDIADQAGWTALHVAASIGNLNIVDQLLAAGAPVNAKTSAGQTPLQLAVSKQHIETVKALIAKGANVKTKDKYGKTALARAASIGSAKLVELLLEAGASINATDQQGWSALHDAVAEGNADMVALLINRGADKTRENIDGETPLQVAPDLKFAQHIEHLFK